MKRVVVLTMGLLFCLAGSSLARTILLKLKDGELIRGQLISKAGDFVEVRGQGGVRKIEKDKIQWMRGESLPRPPTSEPTPTPTPTPPN